MAKWPEDFEAICGQHDNAMTTPTTSRVSDAQREAFEKWYTSERLAASSPIFAAAKMAKGGDGTYLDYQVGRSWQTWQAALASLGDVVAVSEVTALMDEIRAQGGLKDHYQDWEEAERLYAAILNRGGK